MSLRFLREFLRRPTEIGAIAPSSAALARTICSEIGLAEASVIVEYGPGTGVFTREILRRARPGAEVVAIEKNPALAARLTRRFPQVRVSEASVEQVGDILAASGLGPADCIVCGLPWAAFGGDLQDRLMTAMLASLRPGGWFATFAYLQGLLLPAGKRFGRRLTEWFPEVRHSPVVWRNIPPAFVYRCRRA